MNHDINHAAKDDDLDIFSSQKKQDPKAITAAPPKSLAEMMLVNLVINDKAEVMLLHDQQFPFLLNWAEFDADLGRLSFVSFNGIPIDLGLEIPKLLHKALLKNTEIKTVLLQNNELVDFYFLPLITRSTGKGRK